MSSLFDLSEYEQPSAALEAKKRPEYYIDVDNMYFICYSGNKDYVSYTIHEYGSRRKPTRWRSYGVANKHLARLIASKPDHKLKLKTWSND